MFRRLAPETTMHQTERFHARAVQAATASGTPAVTATSTAIVLAALVAAGCANVPRTAPPACARPAPLLGQYDGRAAGYQVHLRAPSEAGARELVSRHGLKPRDISSSGEWIALPGVSPTVIAALRCDAAVESVQFDTYLGRLVR